MVSLQHFLDLVSKAHQCTSPSAKIRAVTLGSNFTARIFLIGGGLAGGQGSQGTTRAPILLVKAIQMQCLPNAPLPQHAPQAAARLNGRVRTFVTAILTITAQSPPKLYINTW